MRDARPISPRVFMCRGHLSPGAQPAKTVCTYYRYRPRDARQASLKKPLYVLRHSIYNTMLEVNEYLSICADLERRIDMREAVEEGRKQ